MAVKSGSSNKALVPLLVVGAVVVVGAGAWALMSGGDEPEAASPVMPPAKTVNQPNAPPPEAAAPKPTRSQGRQRRVRDDADAGRDDSRERAAPATKARPDDDSKKRKGKRKSPKKKAPVKKNPPSFGI
ncbi:MAG: hypothetical protein GY778_00825 [bacterium]|nr:hypothetical protein [bacterium]